MIPESLFHVLGPSANRLDTARHTFVFDEHAGTVTVRFPESSVPLTILLVDEAYMLYVWLSDHCGQKLYRIVHEQAGQEESTT